MTFRVGMKVVCIGLPCLPKPGKNFPTEKTVYTIRAIAPYQGRSLLFLTEIVNAPVFTDDGFCEQGFNSVYFRPAVSPSISFDTSIPADPDSEQHDNRRRIPVSKWGCSA